MAITREEFCQTRLRRAQIPEQGPRRYRQLRVAEDLLAFEREAALAVKAMLVGAIAYFVWPAGMRCW